MAQESPAKSNEVTLTPVDVGIEGVASGSATWGYFQNDGAPELLVTGVGSAGPSANIYENEGDGTFQSIDAGLVGVGGDSDWGDYDGDGDLDVVVTGTDSDENSTATIYRNDGGEFSPIGANLTGVKSSSVAWGDYDEDDDLDLAITGLNDGDNQTAKIYRNEGGGSFQEIGADLPGVGIGSVDWGDFDGDGDLDLVITGRTSSFGQVTQIYRNDGGSFETVNAGLTDLQGGSVSWGDFDGDGDLDLVTTGYGGSSGYSTIIYENQGSGTFQSIDAGLFGMAKNSSTEWEDFNGDGRLDLTIAGSDGSDRRTIAYRNEGNGNFQSIGANLTGVRGSSVDWGDYDGDGDLDLVVSGRDSDSNLTTRLYKNGTSGSSPPQIDGYTTIGTLDGNAYYLSEATMTWSDAKAAAEQEGGHLATITSQEESDLLSSYIEDRNGNAWIGFTDRETEGNWQWITGEEVTLTNWDKGEPNNAGDGEDRAAIWAGNPATSIPGSWNDYPNSKKLKFIMEVPSESPPDLEYGLIAYYPFNGNANDESGNGNDGTVNGATLTTDRSGNAESAYNFDGNDDYIDLPDGAVETEAGSVCAWFLARSTTEGENDRVFSMSYFPSPNGTRLYLSLPPDQNFRADFISDQLGNVPITLGEWYHTCFTWNSDSSELYVNGNLEDTSSGGEPTNGRVNLGSYGEGFKSFLDGKIDQVRIYNRPLTEEEVQQLYGGEGGGLEAPTDLQATSGDGQVDLTWNPGGDSNPDGYNVYRSTSSFSDISNATKLNGSLVSGTNYPDTEVTNGTKYFYRVTAVGSDGNESAPSKEVQAKPTPSKLQISEVQPASGVSLNWKENVTLTVTITDGAGSPVEGATLAVEDGLRLESVEDGGTSDENGEVSYELDASGVSEGEYSLSFVASKEGFGNSEPREFIAEVDLSNAAENLLNAIANIATDQIGNLREEYEEENIKHLAYLGLGVVGGKSLKKSEGARPKISFVSPFDAEVAIYVDVDDLLQITEEGKNGEVTVYLDAGLTGPTVGLPIPATLGFLKVPFESKAVADPDRSRLSLKLADVTAVVGLSAISVNSKGEYKWIEANTSSYELNLSASVLKLNWNFFRGETSSNTLTQAIEENLPNDLSEVEKEDFSTKSILQTFAEASDQKGISYQEVLSNGTLEPFTRSDRGDPRDVGAFITHGRGGFDGNGDGIPDNQCPVPGDSFSRIPKFNINFVTHGATSADYLLVAESIPRGWAVETRDGSSRRSYLSKPNVAPGTEVTTNWDVYQESEGNPGGRFRFVLYQGSLISGDSPAPGDPLDTLLVDVETYQGDLTAINAKSPVDLEVGLPSGSTISKDQFNPLASSYARADIDDSGDTDTQVLLADPPEGEYEVDVVPADTAQPTDTYTLEVAQPDGSVDTLASDQEVQDTPDEPYVTSQGVPVSPSSLVVNANDDNNARLEWAHQGDTDGLLRYRIYRDTTPFGDSLTTQSPVDSVGGSALNYTDESAEPGDTYYYRVTSIDKSGTESKLSGGASIFLYPQQVSVDAERSFGDASGPEDYQLVALPGGVGRSMSDVVSGEAGADWQAFWDDGSAQSYLQRFDGSSTFTFRPGTGFWLTNTQDWTFEETLPTVQLQDSFRATIEVHEGWNILSNPLDKDVSWAAVDSVNGRKLRSLWKFDGSFSQTSTFRSAKSGEAFYFLNDTGLDSLQVPYPEAPADKLEGKRQEGPFLTIRAYLKTKTGASISSAVQVQLNQAAEAGLDRLDQPAPPDQFSAVSLRLKAPSEVPDRQRWLAAEQRPPIAGADGGHTFDLRLQNQVEEPVWISASGLEAVEGSEVKLLRPATGRTYDLKSGEPVTLQETDSTALRLAVGSAAYVQDQADKVVPDEVTLTLYPNPMRRQATLEYTLPEAREVRLTVYDVLGRRVATLKQGQMEAGRHRARLRGDQLSSGVYFGRLKVGSQTRTQKITVVR